MVLNICRTRARYIHYHPLCENNNAHGIYCKNARAHTRGIQSSVSNARRVTLCPSSFQSLKICTRAKLCRWKSQSNYCFGDYFISIICDTSTVITLYLARTGVSGIYRVTGMLIKTGRGITRGPIPLITRESGAAAVWCKCTRSNASALAMCRGGLIRSGLILSARRVLGFSTISHTDAKRFQVKPGKGSSNDFPSERKSHGFNLQLDRARRRVSIYYVRDAGYFPHRAERAEFYRTFIRNSWEIIKEILRGNGGFFNLGVNSCFYYATFICNGKIQRTRKICDSRET